MKASELRIGNLFNLIPIQCEKSKPTPTAVDTISKHCGEYLINEFAWDQGSTVGYSLSDLEKGKIPLTEEWLLKFGFEEKNGIFQKQHIYCKIKMEYVTIINNHGYLVDLKYVHQLQNLYFDLTGEELILQR